MLYLSNYFGFELIFVDWAELPRVGGGGGIVSGQDDGGGLDGGDALNEGPAGLNGHYYLPLPGRKPPPAEQGVARPVRGQHAFPRYPIKPEWPDWHESLSLLGGVKYFGDLGYQVEQFLSGGGVGVMLGLPSLLGGTPEEIVKAGMGFEMLGLEVICPEHPEMALHELGPFVFNDDAPHAKDFVGLIGILLIFLADGEDRFGLNPGLGGIIHAARQVAVSVDGGSW